MGIFPDPQPTQEEITKQQVKELNAWVSGTIQVARERTAEMFNRFWNNANATPMQMSATYGVYAKDLFVKLAVWQQSIQAIDPSYVPLQVPEKYEYVINEDGTVTITELQQEEPQ
jgi:hypothetical protein